MSALGIRRLKRRGHYAVGEVPGLMLQVSHSGAQSWILRVMVAGKRKDIGLGGFPDVTLQVARDEARRMRAQIRQGIDPLQARYAARAALLSERAKAMTFDQASAKFLENKVHEFSNEKHAAQWKATLTSYASPVIGKLAVGEIEVPHIVKILEPLWTNRTETASRLRGRIESVLAWATVSGFRKGDNPARWRGNLDAVLPKPGKVAPVKHMEAVPVNEIPAFMAALALQEGIAALALRFLTLTSVRTGPVRFATKGEIDQEARTWNIPGAHMKTKRPHRVPLSNQSLELLNAVPEFADCDLLFPGPKGNPLSNMAMIAVMRRMNLNAVPHGMRSAFKDWCRERTNYPNEVSEAALSHIISDRTEAAYARGDLFAKRASLMQDWATFCASSSREENATSATKAPNGS